MSNKTITFEIKEHLGVLSERSTGFKKELNKVSWNGTPEKYDIREWDGGHEKMTKGITMTNEEVKALKALLNQMEI